MPSRALHKHIPLALAALSVICASLAHAAAPDGAPLSASSFDVSDYRLGTADKVKVTVFNETTLSGEYVVSSDGSIAFPLIGNVPAAGRTPVELQKAIRNQLADGYLVNPNVAVEIESFRPFYIYGEVNHPGEVPYESGMTVLKAVALAQGFTYRADRHRIYLKRSAVPGAEVRAGEDAVVQPGDTIRVGERYF